MEKLKIIFILYFFVVKYTNSEDPQKIKLQEIKRPAYSDSRLKNERKTNKRRKGDRKVKHSKEGIGKIEEKEIESFEICSNDSISIFKPNLKKSNNSILFGKISEKSFYINLNKVDLPYFEVDLAASNKTVDMTNDKFISPATFKIKIDSYFLKQIIESSLIIYNNNMNIVEEIKQRSIPNEIVWRKITNKKEVIPDNSYFYSLSIKTKLGENFTIAPKSFIIRKVAAIRTKIKTKNLESYEAIFAVPKTQRFLNRLSTEIKKNPEETIHLVGFVTDTNPRLCDNMYRLRNFLVARGDIPIERFYVSCSKTVKSDPESNFITIAGTRQSKNIDLIDFRPFAKHSLKIDNKSIDLDENNLFIFPEKKAGHIYDFEITFSSGLKYEIRDSFEKFKLNLMAGENNLEKTNINLQHDFSPYISCGFIYKNPPNWSISLGLGPYNMSTSIIPGISQTSMLSFSLKRKNIRFIKLHNFVMFIDVYGVFNQLTTTKGNGREILFTYAQIGYEFKNKSLNIIPFLGYYYTGAKNPEIKDNSFMETSYGGLIGSTFLLNKLFWNRFTFENTLKIKPVIIRNFLNYGVYNDFIITYHFSGRLGTSFKWFKNTYKYKSNNDEYEISDNFDAYIFSFVYKI